MNPTMIALILGLVIDLCVVFAILKIHELTISINKNLEEIKELLSKSQKK